MTVLARRQEAYAAALVALRERHRAEFRRIFDEVLRERDDLEALELDRIADRSVAS